MTKYHRKITRPHPRPAPPVRTRNPHKRRYSAHKWRDTADRWVSRKKMPAAPNVPGAGRAASGEKAANGGAGAARRRSDFNVFNLQ